VAIGLIALTLAWTAVAALRVLSPRLGLIDAPNQRSSHQKSTPLSGGLAFVVTAPLVAIAASRWADISLPPGTQTLMVGGLLVAVVGLADDRFRLPAGLRFGAYLAAALLLVADGGYVHELQWPGGPGVSLGWLGVPITILWMVGLTNGYNFMDGIDGIAATQAVVAAATVAVLSLSLDEPGLAIITAALAGATGGFLLHNWPPARIFMGDVGSAFLGYTFAGLAVLMGGHDGASIPFALWLILLAPFVFDTALTLGRRVARGERWYEAHREHLYQRLTDRGWTHLAVTSTYLSADLYLAGVVAASLFLGLGGVALALAVMLPLGIIYWVVKWAERRGQAPTLHG
jgi:Fuc2NAc and GlcNAc transferase